MNYRVSYVNYLSDDHLSWTFVEINSIKSVRYQGDCNTASDLRFGAALSESVEVEVFNDTNVMLQKGHYIKVEIQNGIDGAWTYYGRYKVDKVVSHEISYTAYAYDCIFDLDVDFSARLKELNDNGAFPMTMARLAEEAVGVAGLNANYVITTSLAWTQILVKSFFSSNITCKDILIAASALTCQILEDAKNSRQYTGTAWTNNADICFAPYYEVDDIRISNTELIASTYRDIYYKENGLQLSDDKVNGLTEFKILNSQGDWLGGWEIIIPPDPDTGEYPPDPPASVYHVGGNILVDNAIGFTSSSFSWDTVADDASANVENAIGDWTELSARSNTNMPCSLRVEMFPFYCPLKAGDLVWWHNQQFRIPIMHMTLDESVAEISCGGNGTYETSQDQYKTLGEQNTTNMVNIEEIRKIRDVIGPYEPYLKAEDSHAVGDYFVWQNQLVKCTVAITAGDTIAVGTNVSATDVVSELGGSSGDWTTLFGSYESTDTAQYNHTVGNTFAWKNQYVKCTSAISIGDTIAIGTNVSATSINKAINEVHSDVETLIDHDIIGTASTEQIPSNSNLNNYFRPGVWRVLSSTVAETISNYPSTKLGGKIMTILLSDPPSAGGYMLQMALLNGGQIFARYKASSTATPTAWKEFTMQGEITASDLHAVQYTSQSLTSAQKNQVLSNLGLTSDLKAATSVSVSNFFSTNPLSSATYDIRKSGKVVSFYAYFASAPSAGTVKAGYRPCGGSGASHYTMMPVYSKSSPYAPIGSCWVSGTGAMTFYGAGSGGYVSGTWVCT